MATPTSSTPLRLVVFAEAVAKPDAGVTINTWAQKTIDHFDKTRPIFEGMSARLVGDFIELCNGESRILVHASRARFVVPDAT